MTGGSVKLKRVRVPKAPKGPSMSSPSADGFSTCGKQGRANDDNPNGVDPAGAGPLQGRYRFLAFFPWVSPTAIHGMPLRGNSRLIISHCQNCGPFYRCTPGTLTEPCLLAQSGVDRRKWCAILKGARVARGSRAFRLESWLPFCRVTSAGSSEASNSPS